MLSKKAGRKKLKKQLCGLLWDRFSPERSTKICSVRDLVENNFVSLTVPAPCTHRDVVEKIAREARDPIPIESLSDNLNITRFVRGRTCFGYVGDLFNQIAANYPNMRWWISDNGLNMAIVPPEPVLSSFDSLAGKLVVENWKNGKLSKAALWEVAKQLDANEFSLKAELQPAQWKAIAQHNQKWANKAIKTFEQAARNPPFVVR